MGVDALYIVAIYLGIQPLPVFHVSWEYGPGDEANFCSLAPRLSCVNFSTFHMHEKGETLKDMGRLGYEATNFVTYL